MASYRFVIMKVPTLIVLLILTVLVVLPVLADDCGCSDTGDGASDTGSDGSGGDSSGDSIMILVMKGRTLFAEERYNESLATFRDALAINPNDASSWSGISDTLYALGNYTGAVDGTITSSGLTQPMAQRTEREMHFLQRVPSRMRQKRMIGHLQ